MRHHLSVVCRALLTLGLFLLAQSILHWAPVGAAPLIALRARVLFGPVVLLAILTALTADRRRLPLRRLTLAVFGTAVLLAVVVLLRGPGGLPGRVVFPDGTESALSRGAIDLAAPDLRHVQPQRKRTFHWSGALRVPRPGAYDLWATGRGRVEIRLDGRSVLTADGDTFASGVELTLRPGTHWIEATLYRIGPGPRLRVGWTLPSRWRLMPRRSETIPPRALGDPVSGIAWVLTDTLALLLSVLFALWVVRLPWAPPAGIAVRSQTRSEWLYSAMGHALLVALMSWPLLCAPASQGMIDRPDGRLNAWILAWDVHALLHAPTRLFQAPIFHPLPDALAFSEHLLVPAILAAPFTLAGGPVLGYNAALLLGLWGSGLAAQLLARRITGDSFAAFVAGALFAVGAHRWIRLAHLQAQVTLFLPLLLVAIDRFWKRPTVTRGLLVGVLLALQALSSVYVGAIAVLLFAVCVVLAALSGLKWRALMCLLPGLALAALVLAPVSRPYFRMRQFEGMEWTREDVATYATTLESYVASGTRLYGALTQRHLEPERIQDTLFPGLVPLALGIAGLACAPRRYRTVALASSALAIVISLGPQTALYRLLHDHVILVRSVRALSRFSLIPVLALCVLSACALHGRRRLAIAALLLGMLESTNVPIRYGLTQTPSAIARWLGERAGAAVYLPLGEDDTSAMLSNAERFPPLMNGDSGFIPRPYTRAMELLEPGVSEEGLRLLRAIGVRWVMAREELALPVVARAGEERLFAVPDGVAAQPVPVGHAWPTLRSSKGVIVDQEAVRDVSGVSFELDERPWVAAPRVSVSSDGVQWEDVRARASLADATLSLYHDPQQGRGSLRFETRRVRFIRMEAGVPMRPGTIVSTIN